MANHDDGSANVRIQDDEVRVVEHEVCVKCELFKAATALTTKGETLEEPRGPNNCVTKEIEGKSEKTEFPDKDSS